MNRYIKTAKESIGSELATMRIFLEEARERVRNYEKDVRDLEAAQAQLEFLALEHP